MDKINKIIHNTKSNKDQDNIHYLIFNSNNEYIFDLMKVYFKHYPEKTKLKNNNGSVPLSIACSTVVNKGPSLKTVNYLLMIDPSVINSKDVEGMTPLFKAIRTLPDSIKKENIVECLLDFGADPNVRNVFCETIISTTIIEGNYKLTELLLKYNADPNIYNVNGETPLMCSVRHRNYEITKLLLENGADPCIKHQDCGKSIFELTYIKDHNNLDNEIFRLLNN